MKKRALVVDDEPDIVELVSYHLKSNGFIVEQAFDGETALKILSEEEKEYDIIILDLMLPSVDGFRLCSFIRNTPRLSHIPVLILTARCDEFDKVHGLEVGADDYITKPFSPKEFIARVKAILRRAEITKYNINKDGISKDSSLIKIRDLIIDKERYIVTVDDRSVKLSATEFKLLLYLTERPNKVFSREHLLDAVWGNEIYVEPRTVDVHIRRIRSKIEKNPDDPQYIKTMRGVGYYINT
ncbi:MAG: response regulator transcription factor [Thermodesulfovibrionales bacterium]|nr:response regulator transcription factor [Thermodesulfovibrionales bacterium]